MANYQCAQCSGSGAGRQPCAACGGAGGTLVDCPRCSGTSKVRCEHCRGSGKLGFFRRQRCWHCGGTGKGSCQNCVRAHIGNTPGKVMGTKCQVCGGTRKEACAYCAGHGSVDLEAAIKSLTPVANRSRTASNLDDNANSRDSDNSFAV